MDMGSKKKQGKKRKGKLVGWRKREWIVMRLTFDGYFLSICTINMASKMEDGDINASCGRDGQKAADRLDSRYGNACATTLIQ